MSMILRQRGLNFVPGTEWSYSNSGYVLLPQIVARVSGMTFADFLRTRVLEPLGMKHSYYVDDPQTVKDRALAYERQGSTWRQDMMLANARGGAGALLTTASDLLKWNDALTGARFGKFVSEKLAEPAKLANGRTLNYARGLMLEKNYGGTLIWHGGSAAAYKAVLGRFVDQGVSIAVLCNAGEAADGRTAFAGRIFDLFMADKGMKRPPQPAPPANAEGVDPAAVNSKAGLYLSERTGDPLRVTAANGRLAVVGGGAFVALSNDRFRIARPTADFMSMADVELHFSSNDAFELRTPEGEVTRYSRAAPWTPAAEDLQAFAGRYQSDELRAWFDITATGTGLVARLNDATTVPFPPVARDMFQVGQITLRFRRDESGKVVALDFSNPLLRNIRYAR
jgi:CubicO group peptidase (beta-lactamase class C family)